MESLLAWARAHKVVTAGLVIFLFVIAGVDADGSGSEPRESTSTATRDVQPAKRPTFLVTRVIDGDTLELGNGQEVRIVGIDTPEVGECHYETATRHLASLVLDRWVTLTVSDEDRDRYGRLLRYVDVAGADAGLAQIRRGLAIARYDSRDGYGRHVREDSYRRVDARVPQRTCARIAPLAGTGAAPVHYENCTAAEEARAVPLSRGEPGYGTHLDRDGDGSACE